VPKSEAGKKETSGWFKRVVSYIVRFGQDDPTSGATAWLALFTLFLVVETFFSIKILGQTDDTLHGTFVAGNRAWITVQDFKLVSGTLAPNVPVEFRLTIKNGGGEPANYLKKSVLDPQIETRPREDVSAGYPWWHKKSPEEYECKENQFEKSYRTLLHGDIPDTTTYIWRSISQDSIFQFRNALATFYIRGCIKYQTLHADHTTKYCYYFNTKEADGASEQDRDLLAVQCPQGNWAD